MGMSRDSLNGTITGTNLYRLNDNQREQLPPTTESVNIEQVTPTEEDLQAENASITIQRWYRENRLRLQQKQPEQQTSIERDKSALFKQKKPTEDEQKRIRITSPRVRFFFILLNLYSFSRKFNKIIIN
jgi:hypothetical protein